jgi:O-antigen ligase
LVTIGAIGFALAIFVFMVLHNFLESDFLEGDDPAWVAFLLMLAMLRESMRARRAMRPFSSVLR